LPPTGFADQFVAIGSVYVMGAPVTGSTQK